MARGDARAGSALGQSPPFARSRVPSRTRRRRAAVLAFSQRGSTCVSTPPHPCGDTVIHCGASIPTSAAPRRPPRPGAADVGDSRDWSARWLAGWVLIASRSCPSRERRPGLRSSRPGRKGWPWRVPRRSVSWGYARAPGSVNSARPPASGPSAAQAAPRTTDQRVGSTARGVPGWRLAALNSAGKSRPLPTGGLRATPIGMSAIGMSDNALGLGQSCALQRGSA